MNSFIQVFALKLLLLITINSRDTVEFHELGIINQGHHLNQGYDLPMFLLRNRMRPSGYLPSYSETLRNYRMRNRIRKLLKTSLSQIKAYQMLRYRIQLEKEMQEKIYQEKYDKMSLENDYNNFDKYEKVLNEKEDLEDTGEVEIDVDDDDDDELEDLTKFKIITILNQFINNKSNETNEEDNSLLFAETSESIKEQKSEISESNNEKSEILKGPEAIEELSQTDGTLKENPGFFFRSTHVGFNLKNESIPRGFARRLPARFRMRNRFRNHLKNKPSYDASKLEEFINEMSE